MLAFPAVFPYPHSVDLIESLAAVCREAREKAGKDLLDVAVSYPGKRLEAVTFKRFEDGQTGWPKRPEAHVAAYAAAAGVEPIDLWAEALTRWRAAQRAAQSDSQRKRLDRAKALARQAEAAAQGEPGEQSRKPRRAEGR